MIYTPLTEVFVAAAGVSLAIFAQVADSPSAIPTVVSMGSVVGILLWMQHSREQRQSLERQKESEIAEKRESRLMNRIEVLERTHGDEYAILAQKQNEIASKQLEATIKSETMMNDVRSCLERFQMTVEAFSAARPCLLTDKATISHKHEEIVDAHADK